MQLSDLSPLSVTNRWCANRILRPGYLESEAVDPAKHDGLIICLTPRDRVRGRLAFFGDLRSIVFCIPKGISSKDAKDALYISFGFGDFQRHAACLYFLGARIFCFVEGGYLRAFSRPSPKNPKDDARAFFLDSSGFHYDRSGSSTLVRLLESENFSLNSQRRTEARKLIDAILSTRTTKYNDQPVWSTLSAYKAEAAVLVVEQARNDWAVVLGGGSRTTFRAMLRSAVQDHPDSKIYVKIHPDSCREIAEAPKKSYYGRLVDSDRIVVIAEPANPFSLLESVSSVYTFSSMLGFEALMMKKEVHVFGHPFYAGWGLTRDRFCKSRGTNRSLEEIVYAVYFVYQKYINRSGSQCDVFEFLMDLEDDRLSYLSS